MNATSYFGNSWLGLFLKTNEKTTLVPVDTAPKLIEKIEAHLKTDVVKTSMGESNLVGLYCAMNSNGIILPNIATEKEVTNARKTGLNVYQSKEKHNAHGNNILVNDKGGMSHPDVSPIERKKIEETLGVELQSGRIAQYATVGSAVLCNNNGWLAHYNTTTEEERQLEEALKVKGAKGSLNMGVGFVGLAAVANRNGYLAGEASSAFERGRLEEALGLI